MGKIYIFLSVCFFMSCTSNSGTNDFYTQAPESPVNIVFNQIQVDTLLLEDVNSSLDGKIFIKNGDLHFFDQRFGWIYKYDNNGRFLERILGRGNGPSELPVGDIAFHTQTEDNGHVFFGSSFDFYTFDDKLERTQSGRILWKQDKPLDYLVQNPTPEDQRSYELAYGVTEVKERGGIVYIPLMGAFPGDSEFNFTTDLFAREARVLALMDTQTGEIQDIIGRYPPIFMQQPETRAFPFPFFEITGEDEITLAFAPDSLIHVFTKDFKHIRSFGRAGQNMRTDYDQIPANLELNAFGNWMMDQFEEKDFYTTIIYVAETGLLFRSYNLSANELNDGLQIYKDGVLAADVMVPAGMRMAGYSDPWYYSVMIPDLENLQKNVYRFTLDLNLPS